MSDFIIIEENLTPNDINDIYYLIDQFGTWVDGNVSYFDDDGGKNTDGIKKNLQLSFSDNSGPQKLSDIVFSRNNSHKSFQDYTIPIESTIPLISRTGVGGYYNPHHDNPSNGEFSTTIFLNDNFEGGELCLWINDKEERIKLSAGGSVTYKTGIPHMVRKVTKGHRDAVVFWTRSPFSDPFDIEIYRGLAKALRYLKRNHNATLEEANEDPAFILMNLRNSLIRKSFKKS